MYSARWQLALLVPERLDDMCHSYIRSSIGMAKATLVAGSPNPDTWSDDHPELYGIYRDWVEGRIKLVEMGKRYLHIQL